MAPATAADAADPTAPAAGAQEEGAGWADTGPEAEGAAGAEWWTR